MNEELLTVIRVVQTLKVKTRADDVTVSPGFGENGIMIHYRWGDHHYTQVATLPMTKQAKFELLPRLLQQASDAIAQIRA